MSSNSGSRRRAAPRPPEVIDSVAVASVLYEAATGKQVAARDVDLTLVNMTVNQQRDLVVGWFWTMFLLCMFTFMIAIPVNVVVEQ